MLDVDNDKKWHAAFFEALKLEFLEYENSLEFIDEYQLSKEALRMDVLVIKKDKGVSIEKNIGRIFRGNNIFEYKSENDYISINDYYKVYAYSLLYKSFENISLDDITITFVETRHPRGLLKHLKNERGFKITETFDGVYYIEGDIFPIQIVESKKLSQHDNLWLKSLRSNLSTEDILNVLKKYQIQGNLNPNNAYISRVIDANTEKLKEVSIMSTAELFDYLKEVFMEKGLLDDIIKKNTEEVIKEVTKGVREETALEFARSMLKEGIPLEIVEKITKLPIDSVRNLQAQF